MKEAKKIKSYAVVKDKVINVRSALTSKLGDKIYYKSVSELDTNLTMGASFLVHHELLKFPPTIPKSPTN